MTSAPEPGASRIAAARARVDGAKRAILVGAVCTFAVAMGLARATHPGAGSGAQPSSQLGTSESNDDAGSWDQFFGEGDESQSDWGSSQNGWLAPSTGSPQVHTRSS